jgi:hypothetical protein
LVCFVLVVYDSYATNDKRLSEIVFVRFRAPLEVDYMLMKELFKWQVLRIIWKNS